MQEKLWSMESKLAGTGVALVTPFDENQRIDFVSLRKLLDHTAGGGVAYWVVNGTTGEAATLTGSEKNDLLQFICENNEQQLPVVFGIGGNNTSQLIDTIRKSSLDGVAAILSISPYYNKPSQEGIINHFRLIADASPVPVILYNVPGRTSSNLTWETTCTLARHPNIVGVKEASGNLEQCMRIRMEAPDDFLLISGDDLLTLPMLAIGATGVISVLANAFPLHFKRLMDRYFAQNRKEAYKSVFDLVVINSLMYAEGNPVGIKEVLKQMYICENYVRPPLLPASEKLSAEIAMALEEMKIKPG